MTFSCLLSDFSQRLRNDKNLNKCSASRKKNVALKPNKTAIITEQHASLESNIVGLLAFSSSIAKLQCKLELLQLTLEVKTRSLLSLKIGKSFHYSGNSIIKISTYRGSSLDQKYGAGGWTRTRADPQSPQTLKACALSTLPPRLCNQFSLLALKSFLSCDSKNTWKCDSG